MKSAHVQPSLCARRALTVIERKDTERAEAVSDCNDDDISTGSEIAAVCRGTAGRASGEAATVDIDHDRFERRGRWCWRSGQRCSPDIQEKAVRTPARRLQALRRIRQGVISSRCIVVNGRVCEAGNIVSGCSCEQDPRPWQIHPTAPAPERNARHGTGT